MVIREHFEVRETAVTIIGPEELIPLAKEAIFLARESVENAIRADPYFVTSFDPLPYRGDALVIKRMCDAASKAGVGPMAAVAGTIAWSAVEAMKKAGAKMAVVDNGGDIALVCDRPLTVSLYSGGPLKGLGLRVEPTDNIQGICSSSAKIGPSISLGCSNICTVLSNDVSLADACATALGNMVKDENEASLKDSVRGIARIPGVQGAIANVGGTLALCGKVPRLVRVKDAEELITKRVLLS